MTDTIKIIGERIRAYRRQAGMSQEALAEKAGLHATYIGQLERGEKNATIETVEKVASALGLPMEKLFVNLGGADGGADCVAAECYNLISARSPKAQGVLLQIIRDLAELSD